MAYWRSLALEAGTLYGVDQDFVNAQIRHGGDTIPVKIRLKGGGAQDHLGGEKWSLRVRVRGDNAVLGMSEFALMGPQRRNFMLEWFHRQMMREEEVIAKRYEFVDVIINGENKGVYVIDEHYGKTMIESNRLREGPVIRLSQDPLWFEKAAWYLWDSQRDDYYFSADVDAFGSGEMMSDPAAFAEFEKARSLYEGFRNGDLETHEAFDIDKLAKWMAVGDVMGAWHGFGIYNMRFYYNPITSKLEPAPDDSYTELGTDPGEWIFRLNDQAMKGKFMKHVFSDLVFAEKYLHELERVSSQSYLDDMLDRYREEINKNLAILHRDYPLYEFPESQLYKNQERLREILNPYRGIVAYLEEERADSVVVSIASVKEIPIEILNVTYRDSVVLEPEHGRAILRARDYATPLEYTEIEFRASEDFGRVESPSDLRVNYKLLGTSPLRSQPVFPWPSYTPDSLVDDFIRQPPNYQDFDFIDVDSLTNQITMKQGHWVLSRSLVIPKGHSVIANAGTSLDLKDSARILSYSPVRFIGSDSDPVTIRSSDSTGQGLVLLNVDQESFLESVVFENLSEPHSESGWQLTGAVTFYESPVNIKTCKFLGSRSEDALNIVRSRFVIDNSLFKGSVSDALDVDFCEGLLINTSFVGSGNDAIDFSGSVGTVSNVFINGAGDKALSVGENSQITATQVDIKNSKVGVASKDLSKVDMRDVQIGNSEVAVAVYQKKPEFGPGSMSVSGASFADVATEYLVEEDSTLMLNGMKVDGTQKDVAKKIDGE